MFENIMKFFKKFNKKQESAPSNSKEAAKERLHLVLMQDRANVSADFLELMKQEIIEVIKKYIDVDEKAIDVRLTNKENEDGTNGAPALYANIPILNIKNEARKIEKKKQEENQQQKEEKQNNNNQDKKTENSKEDGKKDLQDKQKQEDNQEDKEHNNEKNKQKEIRQENQNTKQTENNEEQESKEEIKSKNN
mgnify:CR=1 FL=1